MPPRYQSTLLTFEEKARNLFDHFGQPAHRGHARGPGGASGAAISAVQSLIQNPDSAKPTERGQLLTVSAAGDSIASGGDYVTFGSEVHRSGFDGAVSADGQTITWPASVVGWIQVEFAWDSYEGGGTVEIEVNGAVPAWGLVGSAAAGQSGGKRRGVDIKAGSQVKIKITQTSGSSQTADVFVEFGVQGPTGGDLLRYRTAVLEDDPLAFWRLGESSGTTAADSSGNGYDGTYQNSPTLGVAGVMTDGSGDTAVHFDRASSQSVAVGDESAFEFAGTAPFTVEAWFNLDALPTSGQFFTVVQKCPPGIEPDHGWSFLVAPGASGLVFTRYESAGVFHSAQLAVTASTDYHAVATYDGTTLRLYLNGAEVDTDATAISMATGTSSLWIAGQPAPDGDHMDGVVDEVAIYTRPLGADEIVEHYTIGTVG